MQRQALGESADAKEIGHLLQQGLKYHRFRVGRHGACFEFGQVENFRQQSVQVLRPLADVTGLLTHPRLAAAQLHQLGKATDAGQGCTQLVRHGCQELSFGLVGLLGMGFAYGQGLVAASQTPHAGDKHPHKHHHQSRQQARQQHDGVAVGAPRGKGFVFRGACQHHQRVVAHAAKTVDAGHAIGRGGTQHTVALSAGCQLNFTRHSGLL